MLAQARIREETLKSKEVRNRPKEDKARELKKARLSTHSAAIQAEKKVLLEPFDYLVKNPGKNMRTMLIEAFNVWIKLDAESLATVAEIVDMLHNASLLIDDIEDSSPLRRGLPTAHMVYGTPSTINCGNYVYFLALQKVLELKSMEAVEVFTEELCNLHHGQGLDLYWRDNNVCPSEEDYVRMINSKTSALLRLAIRLMQVKSEDPEIQKINFAPLLNLVGTHFQVRDDFVNIYSIEYHKEKGFCEDVSEGKFSYPIIHCVQSDKDRRLMAILKQKTQDMKLLEEAAALIKDAGSLDYTVHYIRRLEKMAREEIARLGGNPHLSKILDKLSLVYSSYEGSK